MREEIKGITRKEARELIEKRARELSIDAMRHVGQAIGYMLPIIGSEPPIDPKATERTLEKLDALYKNFRSDGAAMELVAVIQGTLEGLARDRFDKLKTPAPGRM